MEIRSDRHYRYDVASVDVWDALTRVEQYPTWWPWLREFDGVALRAGERWRCVVRPRLPYTVRFEVELTAVVDQHLVRAQISGDIAGRAQLELADHAAGCELVLTSALGATGGMPRVVARYLRPLATMGHDQVLDTGARQFRRVVAAPP